jgi:hypothetical protein
LATILVFKTHINPTDHLVIRTRVCLGNIVNN